MPVSRSPPGPAINMSQSDGGDISVSDSASKPKQTCHFCCDYHATTILLHKSLSNLQPFIVKHSLAILL